MKDLLILIDTSESMYPRMAEVNEGIRALIKKHYDDQRTRLTIVTFSESSTIFCNRAYARDISPPSFSAAGGTALFSTICSRLPNFSSAIKESPPDKVAAYIFSDGDDNCSTRVTVESAKAVIAAARSAGWQIHLIGLGLDLSSTGALLGLDPRLISSTNSTVEALNMIGHSN